MSMQVAYSQWDCLEKLHLARGWMAPDHQAAVAMWSGWCSGAAPCPACRTSGRVAPPLPTAVTIALIWMMHTALLPARYVHRPGPFFGLLRPSPWAALPTTMPICIDSHIRISVLYQDNALLSHGNFTPVLGWDVDSKGASWGILMLAQRRCRKQETLSIVAACSSDVWTAGR